MIQPSRRQHRVSALFLSKQWEIRYRGLQAIHVQEARDMIINFVNMNACEALQHLNVSHLVCIL